MPLPNPATRYSHAGGAAPTTLQAGISSAAVTFTLNNAAGWPDGSQGPFFVVLSGGLSNEEKVLCSARTGNICTVSGGAAGRGQDGTGPQDHAPNAGLVYPSITAFEIDLLNAHAASATQVHGVAGAVVGTTDAQTLAAKTINTSTWTGGTFTGTIAGTPTFNGNVVFSAQPSIADLTNIQHDHSAASKGGAAIGAATITGATLAGTIAGSPILNGAPQFTGDPIFQDAAAGGIALLARVSGDGTPRFAVNGDGKIEWGSGSATRDTTLFRASADHLQTDDAFEAALGLTVGGKPARIIKVESVQTTKTTSSTLVSGADSTIVTAPAITVDGSTRVLIIAQGLEVVPSGETAPHTLDLKIMEGANQVNGQRMRVEDSTINDGPFMFGIDLPAAGSRTYTLKGNWGGANNATVTGSSTNPIQIAVIQFGA